ncbi:hypothetical protein F511_13718 [Dorcoceras hygrometricum]|uniref:Uncharacterized protein n=1 Tax=Dorcoceras hygrometricum TaxID=472368 RepID=A0A2Z7B4X9_9LAMI|nr:hypothetical protein F511_13718 [Dorcoceras hygrometricum]
MVPEVEEFCHALGGKRAIHSILIANNGMAAVKFIHSIRSWAYQTFGTDKAMFLVAMATPEDMKMNAQHVRAADQFVPVPGGTNNNNYANVHLIVEVKIPKGSSFVAIPDAIYQEACVHTEEEAIASCRNVGYPAMIKASWGGGGKGIRKNRHLEVQLLCDEYGNVAAVHSRDCSVQRRHQKIIEEGPITVARPEMVKELEQAARRLAKSVNYVGAATVEYLYSMETGEYYFLELNPRLQVEHPVTEWIAQVSLPAAQVAIGMGIPLWKIPEIRRFYGIENGGEYSSWRKTATVSTPFNFDKAEATRPKGHCVAVRVTSEDPDDAFKPTNGKIQELSFKSEPNVWAYFSVKSGGGIHEFSDSQFGHIFSFGESRAVAIGNMVRGLKGIQIRGEICTNVDYIIDLLQAADYRENKVHTGWLDYRIAMRVRAERLPWYILVAGGALYKASASNAAAVSEYVGYLEKGQIPPKHISVVDYQVSLNIGGTEYTINMVRKGPGSYRLRMNDSEIEAEAHILTDGSLLMQASCSFTCSFHIIYAEEGVAGTRLLIDGCTCLLQNDHDPSKLLVETPCKLLRYLVENGSHVNAETPYAEVEVMKMCMPLVSPASGKIKFEKSEGQVVQAGELIARLELDDSAAIRTVKRFLDSFPVLRPPTSISGKLHQQFAASLNAARMVLAGYKHNIDEVVENLISCLDNPELPFLQWQECFSVLANRLPKDLRYELEANLMGCKGFSKEQNVNFPAKVLRGILEDHLKSCLDREKGVLERVVEPLVNLVKSYEGGVKTHASLIVQGLFKDYLSVEELFGDDIQVDVSEHLRHLHKKDLRKVVDLVLSHQPFFVKGSMRIKRFNSGLIASWEFLEEHAKTKNGCVEEVSDESVVGKYSERKCAAMAIIKSLEFFRTMLTAALSEVTDSLKALLPPFGSYHPTMCGNIMHIALLGTNNQMNSLHHGGYEVQSEDIIKKVTNILKEGEISSCLQNAGVSVISSTIQIDDIQGVMKHSFHWSEVKLEYVEECILRHLEPPLSSYLELDKLKGFGNLHYTPSQDKLWHLYTVTDKRLPIRRMFLRGLVRQPLSTEDQAVYQRFDKGVIQSSSTLSSTTRSILRSLMSAIDPLELSFLDSSARSDHTQIYLCILPEQKMDDVLPNRKRSQIVGLQEELAVEKMLDEMADEINASIGLKMHSLGVCEWEVKLWISSEGEANGAWRVVVTDITGHNGTVHAFEAALDKLWIQNPGIKKPTDKAILRVTEFVFEDRDAAWRSPLVSVERKPGLNDVGLVAWRMEILTPEFPSGRTIIVISNDVTFKSGSFGPEENAFFMAVTNFACSQKLPLIYLAATTGSRIAVEEEVKSCFKVGWFNESNQQEGFEYLYLTPEDYSRIGSHVAAHELKLLNGETRWVIDIILGKNNSESVMKEEDLSQTINGSGAIASAYLRAYKETFTLTYVTGTTVGIGAYLARFGIRSIQRQDQPIILTGFSALNKLLKREVYSSNMQLGGPEIMAKNGVVHLTVSDDVEGVSAILKWLSFVPPYSGGPLPSLTSLDPPERPVEYLPETSCDPSSAIRGTIDANGKWLGGIFDKDSFVETQKDWARTVVTGRGKLGGIPVGIIAAETQTQMLVIPADPGQLDSCERVIPQAGQLWHPDSATKTAQAILDFNQEGLPLFMLANWRGFSGGQRDLFEGILQTGSEIVDNLRSYRQPIFIYIPMMGELWGGPWVVVDRNINPDHVETYAEVTAKGNILEPEGLIEVKFRTRDLLECMGRLDHKLMNLKLKCLEVGSSVTRETMEDLQKQIKSRENQLLPIYTRVALKFADLHDNSASLAVNGVVREVVEWKTSRSYFYKRLRRRTAEDEMIKNVMDAAGNHLQYKSARDMIKSWFLNSSIANNKDGPSWNDDEAFFSWKDDSRNYEGKLHDLCVQKLLLRLLDMSNSPQDLLALPRSLDAFLEKVNETIIFHFCLPFLICLRAIVSTK